MGTAIYYIAGFFILCLPIALIIGLVNPRLIARFVRGKGSRASVALRTVGLFLMAAVLLAVFEPANIKQARLSNDKVAAVASEQKTVEQAEAAEELEESEAAKAETEKATAKSARDAAAKKSHELYAVDKVIDGDTIRVKINGVSESVRLVGIDTPEKVECYSSESTAGMKALVTGKKVRLERDAQQADRDKYKRMLRFVFLEDGTSVNKRMLDEGLSFEALYTKKPHVYRAEFQAAQAVAKSSHKGLWSPSTCNGSRIKPLAVTPNPVIIPPTPLISIKPQPAPAPTPPPPDPSTCDKNYTPCVPIVSYDLDCPDIGISVTVIGYDHHRFDSDHDGIGCDSYL